MKLELCGYFDRNFGDDYMQKIAAHMMPECEIYVNPDDCAAASPLLLGEPNVRIKARSEIGELPVLAVTGSGFMVNSFDAFKCELVWFLRWLYFDFR